MKRKEVRKAQEYTKRSGNVGAKKDPWEKKIARE